MSTFNDSNLGNNHSWSTLAYTLLTLYLAVEVAFYFYFHRVIVPRANQRLEPSPYLDYPKATERHLLLERILHRLERQAVREGVPLSTILTQFLVQWFAKETCEEESSSPDTGVPGLMRTQSSNWTASSSTSTTTTSTSTSSTSLSDDTSSISSVEEEETPKFWSIPGLGLEQINEFLAWALFAKEHSDLTKEEYHELKKCLDTLRIQAGLIFAPLEEKSPYKPRRLCLEDVSPLHRPLLVYVWVEGLRSLAGLMLRLTGFVPVSNAAVPGWYRPGKVQNANDPPQLPLVFFHGIAPAGLTFYLPMIWNLVSDGRPTLLVEQPSISGRLGTFGALDETQMMESVEQMVQETVDNDPATRGLPLLWAGHSFGSCPLTWMLRHSTLRKRSAGLLLLDPVTILLSEPAVMMNFLYAREISKIRMVAASEVFTEYYLRRHFAWYNAEAWIEDVKDCPVTVALSGDDEIVDAPAVAKHLSDEAHVRTIYWPTARHAHCVTSPAKWRQLQQALWQQEATYWQEHQASS